MNHTKTIASVLLLMILPFASPTFASDDDDDDDDRGRRHEYREHRHGHHGHHDHHRHHYRHHHYDHHDRHHNRYYGGYRPERRWHDNQATVTLPFPPLPPFPVIIFKPHH